MPTLSSKAQYSRILRLSKFFNLSRCNVYRASTPSNIQRHCWLPPLYSDDAPKDIIMLSLLCRYRKNYFPTHKLLTQAWCHIAQFPHTSGVSHSALQRTTGKLVGRSQRTWGRKSRRSPEWLLQAKAFGRHFRLVIRIVQTRVLVPTYTCTELGKKPY